MKTDKQYIMDELQDRIERNKFNIEVYKAGISVLTFYVGKVPTKRELTKILKLLEPMYPEVKGFVKDSMGKDFEIYDSKDSYSNRKSCTLYGVVMWNGEGLRQDKIDDWKKAQEIAENSMLNTKAQLNCLPDIIALMAKQETEREDLSRAQAKEIEIFEKQCKVSLDGYDYVLKCVKEQKEKDAQEKYWEERRKEVETNLSKEN